ncbi:MAG: flavodoxin-dependent (E)-4-hydroxy-3-methylbut-2-enyl-diphosphate synthase [Negativibacillus sp.]
MTVKRESLPVKAGSLTIGGGAPVSIQSMLNTPAEDVEGSVAQAMRLEAAGCQILRAAIPNREAVKLIPRLKEAVSMPLVADIHFDYRLALESVAAGVDKIRINPGNIGDDSRVKQVVDACRVKNIPIRVGVNSGSLEREILAKYGSPTAQALVDSALYHVRLIEKFDYDQIAISIKSSHVPTMIEAYRLAAQQCPYALHLGVTEAGTARMGLIKSAVGIGSLLCDGIGDTIRVSLTADPVEEIAAAKDILKAVGLQKDGVNIVSCPTCGRTKINLIALAQQVEEALKDCKKSITVAVMGCAVNGPGEAREADIGIAGGDGCALLFKKGEILRKVPENQVLEELLREIEEM